MLVGYVHTPILSLILLQINPAASIFLVIFVHQRIVYAEKASGCLKIIFHHILF